MRVLATRLARGDEEEAVQELWLSTLRSPPDPSRPARPWLAKVLANVVRRRFRDEATRTRHEQTGAEDDAPETPEALAARAELHALVVNEVLALDEPFRQTVLLRFFENLSSEDIARQLKVPAGTVRWRLKEGLDRVRASLDARHGDRASWLGALSPLVLPPAGPWLTTGVILMEHKARVAVIIAAVALLSFIAGWAWSTTPHPEGGGSALMDGEGAPARAPVRGLEAGTTASQRQVSSPPPAAPSSPGAVAPTPQPPAAEPPPGSPSSPAAAAAGVASPSSAPVAAAADAGARFAIDREGIRAAMRSALPEVKDCYESWLAMNPSLGGRLVVTLTIDTDDGVEGRISRLAPLDAGIGHVPFEGCVLSSLSDLRFEPPLSGPVNVTYPLLFSAAPDGGAP